MKRCLFVVVVLAAFLCTGQHGMAQGKYGLLDYAAQWRGYDEKVKHMMVECFHTGIGIFVEQAHAQNPQSLALNAKSIQEYGVFDYGSISARIDVFYSLKDNSFIPIPHAINIALLTHNNRPTAEAWRMARRSKTYQEVE